MNRTSSAQAVYTCGRGASTSRSAHSHLLFFLALTTSALAAFIPSLTAAQSEDQRIQACVAELSRQIKEGFTSTDFPEDLISAGVEGTTSMRLAIARDGKVAGWTVLQSSGNTALDDTTRRLVTRLFPASSMTPDDCRIGAELTLTLPLKFSLRDVPANR
jgi:TonB family protein